MKKNTKDDKFVIGTNRVTGELVYMTEKEFRDKHTHILGSTGVGKTYFMDYLIREFISRGRGVCLIDPLGGLYKRILKFVVDRKLDKKVILIDPNDSDWSVGLNMLEYDDSHTEFTSSSIDA